MFSDRVGSENQERSRRKGMRREGRQHGPVRSVITSSTRNRVVNKFDCLPAAGTFQKVSGKPTNHSKFTGALCDDGCRALPATKSRGKAKGTHKLKSNDVSMNQKFIAWRIMDKPKQHNYIGLSVTEILDGLIRDDPHDYDDPLEGEEGAEFSDEIALNGGEIEVPNVADVDYAVAGESGEVYEVHDHGDDDDDDDPLEEEEGAEFSDEIALNGGEIEVPNVADVDYAVAGESGEVYEVHDHGDDDDDDDDDYDLVFYNVEMDYESEGEEGWCLVEEETC